MPGLAGIAGFVQLPLPVRLTGAAQSGIRRYHFVKRLKAAADGGAEGEDDARLRTILIANFDGVVADLKRVYGAYGAVESAVGGKGGRESKGIARVVFECADAVGGVMGVSVKRASAEALRVVEAEEAISDGAAAAANEGGAWTDADSTAAGDGEWEVAGAAEDGDDDDAESAEQTNEDGEEEVPLCGLQLWLSEHYDARPGVSALQAHVDTRMEEYDERRKEEERRANAARNVPDEDGFITVQRRGRHSLTDGVVHVKAGSATKALAVEAAATATAKQQGLNDFYKFQLTSHRAGEIEDLRKKFQMDTVKLARMREMRQLTDMASVQKRQAKKEESHAEKKRQRMSNADEHEAQSF